MKKFILSLFVWSFAAASFAQVSKTVNLTTAGTLADSLVGQQTTITDLTLSGPINADDLTFIKGMTALKNIDMSGASGVTDLGETFGYNRIITSIVIPNSVTSIGDYAFYYSYELTSIAIPNSVKSVGNYAFALCSGLN